MKKRITTLVAGCLPALFLMAQTNPVNVVTDMKVANGGSMRSNGEVVVNANTAGTGLIINNGDLELPGGITFVCKADKDGMLVNNGSVALPSTPSLVRLKVTGLSLYNAENESASWHTIAFPFKVSTTAVNAANSNAKGVYFMQYDGQKRADCDIVTGNWVDVADGADLLPLTGYSYAMDTQSTVTELIFPASDLTDMYKTSKPKSINYYKSVADTTGWGWNCLGSPYTANYIAKPSHLGLQSGFVYYFNSSTNSYTAQIIDSRLADSNYKAIPPFKLFFVKMDDETASTLNYVSSGVTDGVAGYLRAANQPVDFLSLEISGNEFEIPADRVEVFFGENDRYTEYYNQRTDGPKMFSTNSNTAEMWIPAKGRDFSIIGYPYADYREIPLNVKTGVAGKYYNIGTDRDYEGQVYQSVTLFDKALNQSHDLLSGEPYRFYAGDNSYEGRFVLRLGMETTGTNDPVYASSCIYVLDRVLYVKNISTDDKVSLFDTSGRLLDKHVSSGSEISFPVEQGVYIVRLEGKDPVVKKIVVK